MAHLVAPITQQTSVQHALQLLQGAQKVLLAALVNFNGKIVTTACDLKRTPVTLTTNHNVLINVSKHNYGEIVNQLATLERLIDGIYWVTNQSNLQLAVVEICNPTTSDDWWINNKIKSDLILSLNSQIFLFEISDTKGNNNRKMTNDIQRLRDAEKELNHQGYSNVKKYLICSSSSAQFLTKHLNLIRQHSSGFLNINTMIVEV